MQSESLQIVDKKSHEWKLEIKFLATTLEQLQVFGFNCYTKCVKNQQRFVKKLKSHAPRE